MFCKGVFVKQDNSLFSYNFNDVKLNPDRNNFYFSSSPSNNISAVVANLKNVSLIKKVLEILINYYQKNQNKELAQLPYEFLAVNNFMNYYKRLGNNLSVAYDFNLWRQAFEELYKDDESHKMQGIVLNSGETIPDYLQEYLKNYKVIALPKEWVNFLSLVGIKTDKDIINSNYFFFILENSTSKKVKINIIFIFIKKLKIFL